MLAEVHVAKVVSIAVNKCGEVHNDFIISNVLVHCVHFLFVSLNSQMCVT